MKKQYNLTSLFICVNIILLASCKQKNLGNEKYYSNGSIKELSIQKTKTSEERIVYSFYENGEIKEIHRYDSEGKFNGEQVWFSSTGILDRKIPLINGIANGNAYYFYDTTGALKSDRYFRNNREVFYGAEYWGDSMGTMKASLHFNDNGQIYYKKNFDKNGKFISEEGKRE